MEKIKVTCSAGLNFLLKLGAKIFHRPSFQIAFFPFLVRIKFGSLIRPGKILTSQKAQRKNKFQQ